MRWSKPVACLFLACWGLAACPSGEARAAEVWRVRGGQTTLWVLGSDVSANRSDSSGGVGLGMGLWPHASPVIVPIDPLSGASVTISDAGIARVEGELRHTIDLVMATHGTSISLSPLTIAPLSPTSFHEFRVGGTDPLSTSTLIFSKANVQLHRERRQLVITSDFVMLSPEAARALGDRGLSDTAIGFVRILADVELIANSQPLADRGSSGGSAGRATAAGTGVGPDIIVGELQNMANYGTMQVCRDSGEVCSTDADCNACSGSGGPCLSDADCKVCSASGDQCVTSDDCKTCSGSGLPCTVDAECGGTETCVVNQDCVLSGDTCNITGDVCDSQIAAFSVHTRSCNIGDEPADWISFTSKHPVIAQNLFRLQDGRFEQVGMSWLKHGFFAVSGTFCGPCTVPPGSSGAKLGVGCSDPYSATLNGLQSNLGPRSDVNPHTGEFPYPFAATEAAPVIGKRLQVLTSDLDPAGATYFVEGHYVAADDAFAGNGNNNASYRRFELAQETGGRFVFTAPSDPAGITQPEQCGLRAWQDQDPTVAEVDVQIPGEGLFVVAAKATDLGTGIWQYEYAIQNLNSDRSGRSLEIPLPPGAVISDVGFHDVRYHSGETYDGADWTATVTDSMIKWSTASFAENPNANALRWGTLYNFRFRANVPPTSELAGTTITIGLFKPGLFDEVIAVTLGPAGATIDCNDNGVADTCDLDCNMAGCAWPCGGSTDCNSNGVPDDCELDCNGNGIADTCDIASGLSQDCNANTVPDECEPDCDGDGIPDDCDTFDDTDGDGVVDCDDLCPLTGTAGACQCPETGRCCFTELFCLDDFPLLTCETNGGVPECRVSQLCRDGCLISDVDDDGDIDLFDLAGLQRCFSGNASEFGFVNPGSECLRIFDGISDQAVDLEDYGLLHNSITGP